MTIYDAGPLAAGPLCGLLTTKKMEEQNSKRSMVLRRPIFKIKAITYFMFGGSDLYLLSVVLPQLPGEVFSVMFSQFRLICPSFHRTSVSFSQLQSVLINFIQSQSV